MWVVGALTLPGCSTGTYTISCSVYVHNGSQIHPFLSILTTAAWAQTPTPPPQHLLAGPLFMLPSWSLGFMFCPRTVRMIFLKWFDSNDFPVSYPLIACRIQLILLNVVCKTLHVLPLPSCLPVTWYTLCSNATKLPHLMQLAGACLKHLAGCPLHANSSFKNQLSGPLMQSSLINPDRVNQTLLCTATVANSYLNCCTLWIRDQLKGTDCILLLYLPLVPKRVQMCILDT